MSKNLQHVWKCYHQAVLKWYIEMCIRNIDWNLSFNRVFKFQPASFQLGQTGNCSFPVTWKPLMLCVSLITNAKPLLLDKPLLHLDLLNASNCVISWCCELWLAWSLSPKMSKSCSFSDLNANLIQSGVTSFPVTLTDWKGSPHISSSVHVERKRAECVQVWGSWQDG